MWVPSIAPTTFLKAWALDSWTNPCPTACSSSACGKEMAFFRFTHIFCATLWITRWTIAFGTLKTLTLPDTTVHVRASKRRLEFPTDDPSHGPVLFVRAFAKHSLLFCSGGNPASALTPHQATTARWAHYDLTCSMLLDCQPKGKKKFISLFWIV